MELNYIVNKKEMVEMSTDFLVQKDTTKKQFRSMFFCSLLILACAALFVWMATPVFATAFGILGVAFLIVSTLLRRLVIIRAATKEINSAWSTEEIEVHTVFTEDTMESKMTTASSSIPYTSFIKIQQINSSLFITVKNQASGIVIPAKAFASAEEKAYLISFVQNKINLNPAQ